jgi:hypothetical protein
MLNPCIPQRRGDTEKTFVLQKKILYYQISQTCPPTLGG